MKKNPYVIVYAEGGGARGLMPLVTLSKLREERGTHFMNGVDCVAGPSTGAIYMTGFNRPSVEDPTQPMWSEAEMVEHYRTCCPKIFHLPPIGRHTYGILADHLPGIFGDAGKVHGAIRSRHKYDPSKLEFQLKRLMGPMRVSDGLRSQIIPAKAYQSDNFRFQNILESPENNLHAHYDAYKVATASCMHPLCYPSYPMTVDGTPHHFLDGGLFEHPSHVYKIMRRILPPDTDIHMVILFTGSEKARTCTPEKFDNLSISGVFHYSHKMPLVEEQLTAAYAESMKDLRADLGENLTEINYDLNRFFPDEVPLVDDASPEVMAKLQEIAEVTYKEQHLTMDKVRALFDAREQARYAPAIEEEPIIEQLPAPIPVEVRQPRQSWLQAALPFMQKKPVAGATGLSGAVAGIAHAPHR